MKPEEAIERIKKESCYSENCHDGCLYGEENCAYSKAISAIKEVQQYREIGTVEQCKEMNSIISRVERNELAKIIDEWIQYNKIGTVEECQEAREKQIPKKPVCKPKPYNESVGFNEEWFCPSCGAYIGYFYEGMDEPEQMEYCNECGQHIARDWSDENEDE